MGASTLSPLQKKQYKEIVGMFEKSNIINIEDADYIRLSEILSIFSALGYIRKFNIDGGNAFEKVGNFKDFDAWHKDRMREEKKLSFREWRIAIVSAVIGAIIGLLPWLKELINRGA